MADEIKATIKSKDVKIKTPRKSPVPQSADRITEGALKLELKQRVDLRNALIESIAKELEAMEANLAKAKEMLK